MIKYFWINFIASLLILLGTYIFDRSLQLGDFGGLVFGLYSFYLLLAQIVVNIVWGLIAMRKDKIKGQYILITGIVIPLSFLAIVYLLSRQA